MSLPERRLPRAVREFLRTEAAGGVVLVGAAVVALAWANSPWQHGYRGLWTADRRHVVNDGLMAIFFFVVGLEIKRELVTGELRTLRRAALPAIAALGGMMVPAVLFAVVNAGGPGSHGWGIPMATDIAFAVGVLVLLGDRVPGSLKVFLLTLAVVDDIGAIVVIAVFYAGDINFTALATAGGVVLVLVLLRVARVTSLAWYLVAGAGLWWAVYESGVHATVAGVLLALLIPSRSGQRLEQRLHPFTSYAIIPVFALANAGVAIDRHALAAPGAVRVLAGVMVGLVVGKPVGIVAASWLALRLRAGVLPDDLTLRHVAGAGVVAGIGFTVALFVAGVAFEPPGLQSAAKLGILAASALASAIGFVFVRMSSASKRPER
jgi:NhaA family Na+:H+ antiporter